MSGSISLSDLNPAQREAVQTLGGPLLVLAGAGTGKTRVVTYRIANLIKHGTRPERILAVTFTNKAANEMRQRVGGVLGSRRKQPKPEVSTFHSLCLKILRRHIQELGYPQNFSIFDRGDQEGLARQALREIKVPDTLLRPGDLLAFISRCKSASVRAQDAISQARTDKEHLAAAGYRRYQAALKTAGAVDFDDLLLCTEELFRKSVAARRAEAGRFDQILIDEYQDTNSSQYRIIKAVAAGHRNLCVVGDDDQSIYGWRGAEVKHILRFQQDWPDAKVVRLEENYRSTAAILEWANRLIAFNRTRHPKTLRAARPGGTPPRIQQFADESQEAEKIVGEIARRIETDKCDAGDIAILFRTNEQPRAFETELRRLRIPYVLIGGMSFFDRREVRDMTAYLRVLTNPNDDPSLRRIINSPPRGISQDSVKKIAVAASKRGQSVWQALAEPGEASGLPRTAAHRAAAFVKLVRDYQKRFEAGRLTDNFRRFLGEIDYTGELARRYENPEERQGREAAIEEVVNAMATYENKTRDATLQGFLDEIALSTRELDRDKEKKLNRNSVILMTLHSAKGLEFPHVYMVGMEEGILPHHRSLEDAGNQIEEERRLCYVGVTRAQEQLTLSLALSRRKWGKPRPTNASRFLFEITGQAERFEPRRKDRSPPSSAGARLNAARKKADSKTSKGSRRSAR